MEPGELGDRLAFELAQAYQPKAGAFVVHAVELIGLSRL